jgi:hypothetical protein
VRVRDRQAAALQNGVYRNNKTGTQVHIPAGWTFSGDGQSGAGGEYALLNDATGQEYFVWMRPAVGAPSAEAIIPVALENNYATRIQQHISDGLTDFAPRAGSNVKFGSGMRQGINAIFDYHTTPQLAVFIVGIESKANNKLTSTPAGTPMTETGTFIRTSLNRVEFRAIAPPDQQPRVRAQLQMLVDASVIP